MDDLAATAPAKAKDPEHARAVRGCGRASDRHLGRDGDDAGRRAVRARRIGEGGIARAANFAFDRERVKAAMAKAR